MAELSAMLEADVEWLTLADFDNIAEVAEDGETFEQNARKKALGYARATGYWTIADDSGLVVDALDGAPGIKSARFAAETTRGKGRVMIDRENTAKVLKLMKAVADEKRTARFVCNLCLAKEHEVLIQTQGVLEGVISEKETGENGFGYDPIFFVPDLKKTVAQLSAEEKNAISHRGKAINALKPLLAELLSK
jgi:XTP/dITP diphosphohydrolase